MIDTKLGTGAEATPGQHITVHYTGWLFDGAAPENKGRKFDSSRDRAEPFSFMLGAGHVESDNVLIGTFLHLDLSVVICINDLVGRERG